MHSDVTFTLVKHRWDNNENAVEHAMNGETAWA